MLVIGAAGSGMLAAHLALEKGARPGGAPQQTAVVQQTAVLQESAEWLSEAYWKRRRERQLRARGDDENRINPFSEGPARAEPSRAQRTGFSGNYRTLCVRLCDGYYFPVSFSTNEDQLAGDEASCQSSCSSDARLFYYSNAGGSPETMIDRQGRSYADLKTAFLYRTTYNKSCQCKPDPWSDAAQQRHASYQDKGWQKRVAALERSNARRRARSIRESERDRGRARAMQQAAVNFGEDREGRALEPELNAREAASSTPEARRGRGQRAVSSGRMSLGYRGDIRPAPQRRPSFGGRNRTNWKREAFASDN